VETYDKKEVVARDYNDKQDRKEFVELIKEYIQNINEDRLNSMTTKQMKKIMKNLLIKRKINIEKEMIEDVFNQDIIPFLKALSKEIAGKNKTRTRRSKRLPSRRRKSKKRYIQRRKSQKKSSRRRKSKRMPSRRRRRKSKRMPSKRRRSKSWRRKKSTRR